MSDFGFSDQQQEIMEKLSKPIGADGVGEEDSPEEEKREEFDGDDLPEDAHGDEEHGTSEAPTEEDPSDALQTPAEDRLYAGRYKDPESLEQAYRRLEAEFTRRSQAGFNGATP